MYTRASTKVFRKRKKQRRLQQVVGNQRLKTRQGGSTGRYVQCKTRPAADLYFASHAPMLRPWTSCVDMDPERSPLRHVGTGEVVSP